MHSMVKHQLTYPLPQLNALKSRWGQRLIRRCRPLNASPSNYTLLLGETETETGTTIAGSRLNLTLSALMKTIKWA